MRQHLTTGLELLGFGAVAYGCWEILPALGFIVGGVLAVLLGVLLGRES